MAEAAAASAEEPAPAPTEEPPRPEEPVQGPQEYGDMHRLVLQGMMSAGMLNSKGVKRLFVGACSYLNLNPVEFTKMSYVQKVVREVNDRIRPYDMAIRSASCELSGEKFYIFLMTVEKPLMKMQTLFTKFEIDFFHKIMDVCLRQYNTFSMPITECMNMSKEIESKVSLETAEAFILKMMNMGYLAKYAVGKDDFNVTLGFRGIREFEPVLRDMYADVVSNCCLCQLILLHGFICAGCRCHVHKPCYARFDPTCKRCPKCKGSWETDVMIVRTRINEGMDVTEPSTSRALQEQLQRLAIAAPAAADGETAEAQSSGQVVAQPNEQGTETVADPQPPETQQLAIEGQVPEAPIEEMETAEDNDNPESAEEAEDAPQAKAAPRKRKARRGRQRRGSRR